MSSTIEIKTASAKFTRAKKMIAPNQKKKEYSTQQICRTLRSFTIALPLDIYEELLELAEDNRNATIRQAVSEWVEARKARSPAA